MYILCLNNSYIFESGTNVEEFLMVGFLNKSVKYVVSNIHHFILLIESILLNAIKVYMCVYTS